METFVKTSRDEEVNSAANISEIKEIESKTHIKPTLKVRKEIEKILSQTAFPQLQ